MCNLTDLSLHVQPINKPIHASEIGTNLHTWMVLVNSTIHSGPMTNDNVIGDGPALIPCHVKQ
jgi:hypothetical protein